MDYHICLTWANRLLGKLSSILFGNAAIHDIYSLCAVVVIVHPHFIMSVLVLHVVRFFVSSDVYTRNVNWKESFVGLQISRVYCYSTPCSYQ